MSSDKHKSNDITAAVNTLKEKSPKAFVTVEYMSMYLDVCLQNEGDDDQCGAVMNDYVQWAE